MSDSIENFELDGPDLDTPPSPPEESNNRSFLIVAGILGAIGMLVLICIVVYLLVIRPRQGAQQAQQQAALNAQNTKVALAITQTFAVQHTKQALAAIPTSTPTPKPTLTPTQKPTATAVLVNATPTDTPEVLQPTVDGTAVAALQTRVAATAKARTVTPTPTAIGQFGFAEEVGLPTMLGLAAILLILIFLARRLRTAS